MDPTEIGTVLGYAQADGHTRGFVFCAVDIAQKTFGRPFFLPLTPEGEESWDQIINSAEVEIRRQHDQQMKMTAAHHEDVMAEAARQHAELMESNMLVQNSLKMMQDSILTAANTHLEAAMFESTFVTCRVPEPPLPIWLPSDVMYMHMMDADKKPTLEPEPVPAHKKPKFEPEPVPAHKEPTSEQKEVPAGKEPTSEQKEVPAFKEPTLEPVPMQSENPRPRKRKWWKAPEPRLPPKMHQYEMQLMEYHDFDVTLSGLL